MGNYKFDVFGSAMTNASRLGNGDERKSVEFGLRGAERRTRFGTARKEGGTADDSAQSRADVDQALCRRFASFRRARKNMENRVEKLAKYGRTHPTTIDGLPGA